MSLSDRWIDLVEYSKLTDQQIFVVGTCIVNVVVFWGYNAILGVMYYFDMFPQFKIQGDLQTNHELIWRNIRDTLITQFISLPVVAYFLLYHVFEYCGVTVRDPIPSTSIFVRDFCVFLLAADFFGYFWHCMIFRNSALTFSATAAYQPSGDIFRT